MKNEIYQRVYKRVRGFNKSQGLPYLSFVRAGMLVAQKDSSGAILIGASSLHPNDKYDDAVAFDLARKSLTPLPYGANFPTRCKKDLEKFVQRAERYFNNPKFKG